MSRRRVTPIRRFISSQTGRSWNVLPISPRTKWLAQVVKRFTTGVLSFRFSSVSLASIDSFDGGGFRPS